MNNVETWYRKRYALGGGIIGGAGGYGVAHLLKGSPLVKLLSSVAGATAGGAAGYYIGKNKDIKRMSDVSAIRNDDTLKKLDDALIHKNMLFDGLKRTPNPSYSAIADKPGEDIDDVIKIKGDKATAKDTSNATAGSDAYTATRLDQIKEYLSTSDSWEKASIFRDVYRNKKTNAIFDLGAYKRRLNKSVPVFDTANPYAINLPNRADSLHLPSLAKYLYGRSVHIPLSDKNKDSVIKALSSDHLRRKDDVANIATNIDTSSYGTPYSKSENRNSIIGQLIGHEYNHAGSGLISDNLLPSNIQGSGKGMPEHLKSMYSGIPAEVTQHLSALNQRYHRLTGDYVKDKDSFFRVVKHMSGNIRNVDAEGRRSIQMLAGLFNAAKKTKNQMFERALQNYAEIAPVLL